MKNINKALLACFAVAALCLAFNAPAMALTGSDYTASASSFPVTESFSISVDISGFAGIEQVYISASSTATAQTVSVYSNCDSTTTAKLVWRGYIASGGTINPSIHLTFPLFNTPLYIENACFRKSDAASSVQFNVHYR